MNQFTARQKSLFVVLLAFGMCFMPFTVDPFLASSIFIAKDFGTTIAMLQISLTAVTAGNAIGQILAGPLSDSIGRKLPLIVAMALFTLACVGSAFSLNIYMFIGFRALMAIASSAAAVVANGMVRDLASGEDMMKLLSRIFWIQGMAPVFGPLIGAQLVMRMHWHFIFLIFGAFSAAVCLLMVFTLKETLKISERRDSVFNGMGKRFLHVLQDRAYVGLLVISSLISIALFAHLTVSPYVFEGAFGMSTNTFGWVMTAFSACWLIGYQIGAKLGLKLPLVTVMVIGISFGVAAGIWLIFSAQLGLPLVANEIGIGSMVFAMGVQGAASQTLALTPHGSEAGTAAALMGLITAVACTACTGLYTALDTKSMIGVGTVAALSYAICLVTVLFVVLPNLKAKKLA